MPTLKQKRAVEILAAEKGRSVSSAMRQAGYSPVSATKPSKLTRSKGFKEALDEYGLTEELIVTALAEDIKAKPRNRKPELELGAKIRGMLVDKAEVTGKEGGPIEFRGIEVKFVQVDKTKT